MIETTKKISTFTIVRLMRAKARQELVSSYNPALKRGVIGCELVLGFSPKLNILAGQ